MNRSIVNCSRSGKNSRGGSRGGFLDGSPQVHFRRWRHSGRFKNAKNDTHTRTHTKWHSWWSVLTLTPLYRSQALFEKALPRNSVSQVSLPAQPAISLIGSPRLPTPVQRMLTVCNWDSCNRVSWTAFRNGSLGTRVNDNYSRSGENNRGGRRGLGRPRPYSLHRLIEPVLGRVVQAQKSLVRGGLMRKSRTSRRPSFSIFNSSRSASMCFNDSVANSQSVQQEHKCEGLKFW